MKLLLGLLQPFHMTTRRSRDELLLLRLGFALLLYFEFKFATRFTDQPVPHGLAQWFDLTFFSDPVIAPFIHGGLVIALCLYVLGTAMIPAVSTMLFVVVGAGTLDNSQGSIHHSQQIYGLVIIGQWLAYVLPWAHRAAGRRFQLEPGFTLHDLAIHFTLEMIAAGYVVSACMKIVLSKGQWIWRLPNMAIQVLKTNQQQYYNNLEPEHLEWATQISALIISYPNVTRIVVGSALFVELFAFLALINRRWAFFMGVALFCMHESIRTIMNLAFASNLMILMIFFINVPFLLLSGAEAVGTRDWASRLGLKRTAG